MPSNAVQHYFVDDDDPILASPFSFGGGAVTINAWSVVAGQESLIDNQLYASGIMTTELSYGFTNGYVEIRADVPDEQGFWSSFWPFPSDDDWSAEIDVFEILGGDTTVVNTNYWVDGGPDEGAIATYDVGEGYHTYGLLWTKSTLEWCIDGVLVRDASHNISEEMFLSFSLAVGGWAGETDATTDFSDAFSIDYVRVYQSEKDRNANPEVDLDGSTPQDRLGATRGNDTLFGSHWGDVMEGQKGDDTLYGRAGDDQLFGQGGADRLFGSDGMDLLFGGWL